MAAAPFLDSLWEKIAAGVEQKIALFAVGAIVLFLLGVACLFILYFLLSKLYYTGSGFLSWLIEIVKAAAAVILFVFLVMNGLSMLGFTTTDGMIHYTTGGGIFIVIGKILSSRFMGWIVEAVKTALQAKAAAT